LIDGLRGFADIDLLDPSFELGELEGEPGLEFCSRVEESTARSRTQRPRLVGRVAHPVSGRRDPSSALAQHFEHFDPEAFGDRGDATRLGGLLLPMELGDELLDTTASEETAADVFGVSATTRQLRGERVHLYRGDVPRSAP